jgi:hypothetical protein
MAMPRLLFGNFRAAWASSAELESYFLYLGVVWIGRCVYSSEMARHYTIF